jgi:hypothetical protein
MTAPEAIRQAKLLMERSSAFDFSFARFLQLQLSAANPRLPTIIRGLEILGAITAEANVPTLLRFFLRAGIPQIISKCALILGRRCPNVDWIGRLMADQDGRVRANLIEALWDRAAEPDINAIFKRALKDRHQRVIANAVYGLFLSGYEGYSPEIDRLVTGGDPAFRKAGVWVIKSIGGADAISRIRPLILDSDASVRKAAFAALTALRKTNKEEATGTDCHSVAEPDNDSAPAAV